MGPSLPPVPASDERQENQVENYFKGCMQDINIFEEMAIKVFHGEWAKGNTSSLFSITFCWLIFIQKTLPFSVPWKIWMPALKIRKKVYATLRFPTHLKKTIILSANSMQLHTDPSLPKDTFIQGALTGRKQHKKQHSHHSISLKADRVCPILDGHSSHISLGDKSSLLLSSCQQDLKLQE